MKKIVSIILVFTCTLIAFNNYCFGQQAQPEEANATVANANADGTVTINIPPPGVPISVMMKQLTELTGQKYLVTPDIARMPVSMYLPNATATDIVNAICAIHELFPREDKSSGAIMLRKLDTKFFVLKQVKAEEIQSIVTSMIGSGAGQRVSVDKVNNILSVQGTKADMDTIQKFLDEVDREGIRQAVLFKLEHVETADVVPFIDEILRVEEGEGAITNKGGDDDDDDDDDDSSGSDEYVYIEATPAQIKRIQDLLDVFDVPKAQVEIEASIVEINVDKSKEIGINWSDFGSTFNLDSVYQNLLYRSTGDATAYATGLLDATSGNFNTDLKASAGTIATVNTGATGAISFLESNGVASVLASPRIVASHNTLARIDITTEEVVGTEVLEQGDGSNDTTTTFKTADVGITLEVTPRVHEDKTITLNVKPTVSNAVNSSFKDSEGNTALNIAQRSAETTVHINNGQTIGIGGLYRNEKSDADSGVKILNKIPLVGKFLFNNNEKTIRKTDLVIFITLRLLDPVSADSESSHVPVDADLLFEKYDDAVMLYDKGSYTAARILFEDLMKQPISGWRKQKIKNYLSRINSLPESLQSN